MSTSAATLREAGPSVQAEDAALIDRLLERGFPWMRFPGAMEQRFLRDDARRRLRYCYLSGVLSLFVFNGFLFVDYLMLNDIFWLATQLRLLVFTPLAALLLLTIWRAPDWELRHIPPLAVEAIVLITGLSAAASLAVNLSYTHSPYSQHYHVGFAVVVMYGNLVQRLRFWYAVVLSLAIFAIQIGAVLMVPSSEPRLIWPILFLMGATVSFSLTANYACERDERKRYLRSLRQGLLLHELGDAHQRLQKLSRIDVLTGLSTRLHFQDYLGQVWQRAAHGREDVSIVMVDVDHFKKYNDRYGHPAGDACLSRVAEALAASARRPTDLVARFGGEEFIVLLPHTGAPMARQVAERIRHAVESLGLCHEGSSAAPVITVSVGVATVQAGGRQGAPELISAADAALYRAKAQGRNQVATSH
jgi:diguanylate cyclase (GGDEF)-like protein